MGKMYVLSCREVGVDCDFEARGATLEEVMQQCANHGIAEHNMKAFGPELFMKMKKHVREVDDGIAGTA